ncbi:MULTISPECIES: hypothetical protein [Clostridium]|uniref:Phage transcriptional activator, RinA family n=1 Tax=Clostridium frigoriphilum TaxID=443253 RepID=A0ABU7UKM1_9CLOT|nr:hypothetical protein [Clostridium sp. DSM 17811]MBU3098368.1 hypothetical protein [Clostridium sp. DSM 17811]
MDYIREAIEFLTNYDNLKTSLINLELDIREIKADLNAGQIKAIEYSDMPSGDSAQLPDDKLINKMYMFQVKKKEYFLTKKTIKKMDQVLARLPSDDERILRAYYILGLREGTLFKHTFCSERTFYRMKTQAIRTFAIQLHGIDAIK